MQTFFLSFRVIPGPENTYVNNIEGAQASCWICDDDPHSALAKARFKVEQYEWEIVGLEVAPTPKTQEEFRRDDIGLEQFNSAQKNGIAIVFVAVSSSQKSASKPINLMLSDNFSLSSYLTEIKTLRQKGCCLHFAAGAECTKSIDAHSVQKNGALSKIADGGEVYVISKNHSDFKKSNGGITYVKQGINRVSTFRGFCEYHDNRLFEPIDNFPLAPTPQQMLLYAYRSLCREIFVKANAVSLYESQASRFRGQKATYELFENVRRGTIVGLERLLKQKGEYDTSLRAESFTDVKSVLFCSKQKPSLVFSGLFYPDFSFMGVQLQDLSDSGLKKDLMTFSFTPMEDGWGILFAWHSSSSGACVPFMRSLATLVFENGKLADHLLRLVISNCENVAISPNWWDSLTDQQKGEIAKTARYGSNMFLAPQSDYLVCGLENISEWRFERVISNMV